MADAKDKLGAAAEAGNDQAKAIIAGYEKDHADAVTAATTLTVKTAEKSMPELRINSRLAASVEAAERYIRVMERVVYSDAAMLTDRQKSDLQKASEAWRKVLRGARELSFAVKVIEGRA
ncbi:hypothetical protein [Occallatibacter savannae]|uniref:hypothetical protein n=1 Tax=Occallatibacter savannae TaxID=1002691 RepID=UPI0013A58E1B|nr:hypothetical protein [Occallatibacter savannae]